MNLIQVLKHFLPEIQRYKKYLVVMIIGMTFGVIFDIYMPYILGKYVNIINQSPEELKEQMISLLQHIVLIYFGVWIVWRCIFYAIVQFESKSMRDINIRCFKVIQNQSFDFFSNEFSGAIVKKIGRMVYAFENIIDIMFFNLLFNFLIVIGGGIAFLIVVPSFGVLFIVWTIVFILLSYYYAKWKVQFDKEAAVYDSKIGAHEADSLSNYFTVKTFARESHEYERITKTSEQWHKKQKLAWFLSNISYAVQAMLMIALEIKLFYIAADWWQKGTLDIGLFVFIQTYMFTTFSKLWDLGKRIQNLFAAIANAAEMIEIIENDIEVKDVKNANPLEVTNANIDFKQIGFSYNESNPIFEKLSLHIKSGERVAIVGHSGSGKSTLIKLLLRFYNLKDGEISIDNQDISHVTQDSLRNNISLVSQNIDLFHRSLFENIVYGKLDASKEEVIQAAKKAEAHDFIQELKNGYDTLVGERGVKLSGGEKQRVAIARAILENRKILVLDEATSSLDSITEHKIQKAIKNAMEGKTVIVIAHRLSTIKNVDRIIVMNKGEIIDSGTHGELIAKKGVYAELWNHQVGGFLENN